MKYFTFILFISLGLFLSGCGTGGRGGHSRHTPPDGGEQFAVAQPYDVVFRNTLIHLKAQGYKLDQVNQEGGQITTALDVSGIWHQTGTRASILFFKQDETATLVSVAVKTQRRHHPWGTWGGPRFDYDASATLAADLRIAL